MKDHGEINSFCDGNLPSHMTPVTPSSVCDPFDSREFYEVCQKYRWAREAMLVEVSTAFEALKDFCRAALAERTQQEAQDDYVIPLGKAIDAVAFHGGSVEIEAHLRSLARAALAEQEALTEAQIIDATEHIDTDRDGYFIRIARTIERAHGIGASRPTSAADCTAPMQPNVLRALLDHVDGETCRHETTYRGGAIWTICDDCGRKWADDRGGFVPYEDPPAVAAAREALATPAPTQAAPATPTGEEAKYPALPPSVTTFYDDIDQEEVQCFSEHQMRAYYDLANEAADEISDLEKAYELLFSENAKLRALCEANSAVPAAAVQPTGAEEAAEIIGSLIANIESHGMYSMESTLGFLAQAFYCLRPENAAAVPEGLTLSKIAEIAGEEFSSEDMELSGELVSFAQAIYALRPASDDAKAAPQPLTDDEIETLLPDPEEQGESWRDEYGYEHWEYHFSKAQVIQAVRAAIAASTKGKP